MFLNLVVAQVRVPPRVLIPQLMRFLHQRIPETSFHSPGHFIINEKLISGSKKGLENFQFSSVHLLSQVWLFSTPWTAACQASLSITNFWSLIKLMSIKSVMSFNHLILCHPLLLLPSVFPSMGAFPMSLLYASSGQCTGVSASASVLPMNIQDWFPLGCTGWISLQSKGLSRDFSNTTVQMHQFFSTKLSL